MMRLIGSTWWSGHSTTTICVVEQFGPAMMPRCCRAASGFTSGTTNGTDGSRGMGVGMDWNQLGTPTSTDTEVGFDISGAISGASVYKAADTSGTGNTVSLNFDAGGAGTAAWAYKLFEILPAAGAAATSVPPVHRPNWGALLQL